MSNVVQLVPPDNFGQIRANQITEELERMYELLDQVIPKSATYYEISLHLDQLEQRLERRILEYAKSQPFEKLGEDKYYPSLQHLLSFYPKSKISVHPSTSKMVYTL